ncbi:4'-phosphopantetheinyl transferase family protein [Psychrobacter sp. FDAARGOS_221]|uniref:4'-phosphopantetheinyl transferase family protein n=1 Tax=Psychrobacter sp. FDAARGOS_221 TaxID=1975705 RepID=UPI000BB56996|nr:4'-phosphopantetheinyl transferase superfamily protein [Psychrobacter sp. FDAARGOS_221]PNK61680.1 hypothetical protein A6J60_012930 [Psychrobacter sp. FDAARGOS_221]
MTTSQSVNLIDSHLLAYDCHGRQQPLLSSNAKIWLASASFDSVNTALNEQQAQKLAVRQLASQLISTLSAHSAFQTAHQDVRLDDSHYPYRLQPVGYPISFSHSQRSVACAISSADIGIDIELNSVSAKVSKRFFHPNELLWLNSLPQLSLMHSCPKQATIKQTMSVEQARNLLWMLKEASIKALGTDQLISGLKTDLSLPAQQLLTDYQQHMQHNLNLELHNAFSYQQSLTDKQLATKSDNNSHPPLTYLYLPYLNLAVAAVSG